MALRVSLGFAKLPDDELLTFTKNVIDGLTGNAEFPTPPVTLAALSAAYVDFTNKLAASLNGGKMETAAKDAARQALLALLRDQTTYVQLMASNDETAMLSSGFNPMNTNRASAPLDQPEALELSNGNSGELIAKVKPVKNTSMYQARAKGPAGDWDDGFFSGDSRKISITGLTPGTIYSVEVRALGGSTGHSDWSDPSQHMSM